jgi:hypothetical protein
MERCAVCLAPAVDEGPRRLLVRPSGTESWRLHLAPRPSPAPAATACAGWRMTSGWTRCWTSCRGRRPRSRPRAAPPAPRPRASRSRPAVLRRRRTAARATTRAAAAAAAARGARASPASWRRSCGRCGGSWRSWTRAQQRREREPQARPAGAQQQRRRRRSCRRVCGGRGHGQRQGRGRDARVRNRRSACPREDPFCGYNRLMVQRLRGWHDRQNHKQSKGGGYR